MALQIWMPLNGDVSNRGLSDATIVNNGATVSSEGKIGTCYSFDGNDDFISIDCQNLYQIFKGGSQQFSVSFWVYHADSSRAIIFGDYALSGSINLNIELRAGHTIRFYWNGDPDKTFDASTVNYMAWTHIALTYNGSKLSIYNNGVLQSDSLTVTLSTRNKTSGLFYLGRDSRTGSTALNGKLNDFRIYDHCLSPREIAEIAKGLILHYPLAKPGVDNLLTGTDVPFSYAESSDYRKVAGGKTYPLGIDAKELLLTAGERGLTLSYDICIPKIYISSSDTLKRAGAYLPITVKNKSTQQSLGAYYGHHTQTGTATATNNYAKTNSLNPIDASSTADNPDTTFNGHYSRTIYPRQFSNLSAFFADPDSYDVTCSGYTVEIRGGYIKDACSISNVKLEFGDVATPWTPNPADSIYTSMGFDDGIEYDVSGFKNNGEISGSILSDVDTMRYNTSYHFLHDNKANITIPNIMYDYMDYGTVSFWLKINSFKYWSHYLLIANTFSWTGNEKDFIIVATAGDHGDTDTNQTTVKLDMCSYGNNVSIAVGDWHHIAMTWDAVNYQIKKYVDGSIFYTNDDSTNKRLDIYKTKHSLHYIGNGQESDSNRGDFNISDFRIYGTCLSADQIADLYHTPLSLSSNGVLLTQGEYTEV